MSSEDTTGGRAAAEDHANYVECWSRIVETTSEGRRFEIDGVLVSDSSLGVELFNVVYLREDPDDPAATLARIAAHFAAPAQPYRLCLRPGACPSTRAAIRESGALLSSTTPAMALSGIGEISPPETSLDIGEIDIHELDEYEHFRTINTLAYGIPLEFAPVMLTSDYLEDATSICILGRDSAGVPVATSALMSSSARIGIYWVATHPDARRRGHAEALTWRAVAKARALGHERVCLQASEMGAPLYRRMGFEDIENYEYFTYPSNEET